MDGTKEFTRKYNEEQLNRETLPERLQGRFEFLACIHVSETHASFLLCKKETGERYLLKRGTLGQKGSLSIEQRQQTRLRRESGQEYRGRAYRAAGQMQQAQPSNAKQKFGEEMYWTEGGKEYLLRRYIEGQNLEEYLERNPVLGKQEVLDIAMQICDILIKLHHLNPPMIHRDIKPQNLILDRHGTVHLIDFEASRNFDRKKQKDTKFYGSEVTAAPEQYGYAQTDARTDIYAFGKVLCYLLTGDYQVEGNGYLQGRLGAVVRKCCAFDPGKRYQSMQEVKRRLMAEQKKGNRGRKKRLLCVLAGAVSFFAVFLAGIFLGRLWTGQSVESLIQEEVQKQLGQQTVQQEPGAAEQRTVQQEPGAAGQQGNGDLLYQAAAASLNKDTLSEEDFQDVVRIAVIGTTVYDMTENFEWNSMVHNDEDYMHNKGRGTIADITMLGKMPNLSEVYLYNQQITDIEVLAGLPIRKLYLSGNQIEDFRVVEKLPYLKELFISNNPIRYLPDFTQCPRLTMLIMSENTVANLDCLRGSSVERMGLRRLNVVNGDYTFLEEMQCLTTLLVWDPDTELTEEISHLTALRELEIFNYHRSDLEFVKPLQEVETLTVHSAYAPDLSSLSSLKKLSALSLSGLGIEDISVVGGLPYLRTLGIDETGAMDLSSLSECKNLQEVFVNEEQAAYLEKHAAGHKFRIIVSQQ